MIITNPGNGRQFLVRIVFKGDRYGLGDALVHRDDEPLIEFYSRKHASYGESVTDPALPGFPGFGPRGQFCSRYNASVLAEHRVGAGIMLAGDVPSWNVEASVLDPVIATARALLDGLVPMTADKYARWVTQGARLAAKGA